MSSNASPNRFLQLSAFLTAGIFIIGELFTPVGAWTGAVICAWFVGTQKPGRGLLWLLALVLIPELLSNWHATPPTPAARVLWIAAIAILTVLPYALYRLTSMGRQSFLSTLALPFWGVFFQTSAQQWAPHGRQLGDTGDSSATRATARRHGRQLNATGDSSATRATARRPGRQLGYTGDSSATRATAQRHRWSR